MNPARTDGNKMRLGVSRAREGSIVGHARDSFSFNNQPLEVTPPGPRPQTVNWAVCSDMIAWGFRWN
jgi:hypothetical protein